MSIRTLAFGKRVEGETLKSLAEALGMDYEGFWKGYNERTVTKVWGRVVVVPVTQGFDTHMDVHQKLVHVELGYGMQGERTYFKEHCASARKVLPYAPAKQE